MLSTVTAPFLPPATGGGVRTWRSAPWTHMVPTHKTTVVLSNVLNLVSFQRATETTAACVQHVSSTPPDRVLFLHTFASARCGRLGNLLCAGAHGVESAVVEVGGGVSPPTRLKATLIYLIIFQEVTYFVGRAGRGCGGSSPAHQLLLDRPTMVALH